MRQVLAALGVTTALFAGIALPAASLAGASTAGGAVASRSSAWHADLDPAGATTFTDVSCPSGRVCTAVGGGATGRGMIYRTTNGGSTWSRQLVPAATPDLVAVSCATATRCLAVGNGPYAPVFVSTTNGGATWSTLAGTGLFPYYVYRLDCASSIVCYASLQGGLAVTTNGGASWTTLPWSNTLQIRDLSCPSVATCFVVGVNVVQGAPSTSLIIQRYRDDGGSIATVKVLAAVGQPAASISCTSDDACMAVGAGHDHTTVLTTTSGGASWSSRALPPNAGAALGVSCDPRVGCVVVAASPNARGLVAAATTVGGTSWAVNRIAASDAPASTPGTVTCPDHADCVLAGFGTAPSTLFVAHSLKGSWTRRGLAKGAQPLSAAACATAGTCVAVGTGVAVRSMDGGTTWLRAVAPPPPDVVLTAIACPSSTACVTVGQRQGNGDGVAFRSTDGGRMWHEGALAAPETALDAVACPTATTCVATSANGSGDVERTTNGGRSWTKVALPGPMAHATLLNDVSCGSATSCVAVGSAGTGAAVEVTGDAGATWQSVAAVASLATYLESVSCTTASTCWAAGGVQLVAPVVYSTGIFSTTDGGSSWTALAAPTSFNVTAIACRATTCEEVANPPGNYGPSSSTVETSLDGGASWTPSALPVPAVLAAATSSPASRWVLVGGNAKNGALVLTDP